MNDSIVSFEIGIGPMKTVKSARNCALNASESFGIGNVRERGKNHIDLSRPITELAPAFPDFDSWDSERRSNGLT